MATERARSRSFAGLVRGRELVDGVLGNVVERFAPNRAPEKIAPDIERLL